MALCQQPLSAVYRKVPSDSRRKRKGVGVSLCDAQLDNVLALSPSADKAETLRCTWQDSNFPSSKLVLFYCTVPLPFCVPKPVLSASGSVTSVISWAQVPWLPSVPMKQHEPMVLTHWCQNEGHSLYFHSLVITGHLFTFPWIFTPFHLVGLYNEPLATLLPGLLNAVNFLLTFRQGGNSNNS